MGRSLAAVMVTLIVARTVTPVAAAPLLVPVLLEETAGVARRASPTTGGIPFPKGRLTKTDGLWVSTPDGRPVRSQVRPLERWPDKSIRWLLLDFLADVSDGGRATYALKDGGAPKQKTEGPVVRLQSGGGARTIDTGRLRVRIPDDGKVLASEFASGSVKLPNPLPLPTLTIAGAPPAAAGPATISVETEGPVRTELLFAGRWAEQAFAYELRLAFFAGQAAARVQLTLVNLGDPNAAEVAAVSLTVPGKFPAAETGVDGATRFLDPGRPVHEIRHDDAAPAMVDGRPAGKHADGWLRAHGGGMALTLVSRWFWEEYPQALAARPDGIHLDLLAGGATPIRVGSGAAKTFEFWIVLEPEAAAAGAAAMAAALRAPLVPLAAADWTVASQALLQAISPADQGARDFLPALTRAVTRYVARNATSEWDDGPPVPCDERTSERRRTGYYGALNWGDWNFPRYRSEAEGCDAWGNLEYDLPQVLGLGWVATGTRVFWDQFVPAVRHYRDVDVVHHWKERPEWVGMNHPHKALHFAFESPNRIDLGHTWLEGLLTHWRLTGEVRSYAAAQGIADALVRLERKAGNPRQYGWPLIALVAMADASGEKRYLDAATRYAAAATASTQPRPSAGDWKMGILADGVSYAQSLTGDQALRRWLVSYADALVGDEEQRVERDPRYFLPIGQVALLTGDERYGDVALREAAALTIGEWGKPLAISGRTGFRLLAPLAILHLPKPKPPPQRRPVTDPNAPTPPPTMPPVPALPSSP